jgi:hypothetical protein
MPQANAPSILDLMPQQKRTPGRKFREYDPAADNRPPFNSSWPLEVQRNDQRNNHQQKNVSQNYFDQRDDRNYVPMAPADSKQTRKINNPSRNRNIKDPGNGYYSDGNGINDDIYKNLSFPSSPRYQFAENMNASIIIEAGMTYKHGRFYIRFYEKCSLIFDLEISILLLGKYTGAVSQLISS